MKHNTSELRMKNICKSVVFGAVFAASSVQAVSFDDETTWRVFAGDFKQETFDNAETLSVNSISRGVQITELPSLNLKLNNAAYIYDGSSGGPMQSAPFSLINVYPYNSSFLPAISFSSKNGNSLITAVGLYNSSGDDTLILKFYDKSGDLMESTTIDANVSIPIFGGLINIKGAAKVTVEGTGDGNNWIAIDNLQVTLDNLLGSETPKTYEDGLNDGMTKCQNDPASCGITISNGSTPVSGDCMADYSLTGQLHVPCVSVPDAFGGTVYYDIKLNQQTGSFTFDLDMGSVKPR